MKTLARMLTVLLLAAAGATALAVSAAPAEARSSYIVLVQGERGPMVLALQRYLHVQPQTGYFGPITRAAVVRWQATHDRRQTGMVGKLLWSHVNGTARAGTPSRSGDRVDRLDWAALARCESGGNPRAVNPRGYYGLYQFSRPTWRSVGGSGLPHRASSSEQTARAQTLFRRSGASPWPGCGHHLFD